ncbi:hypothetical protein [Haliangium ochraceum]|uniref:Uncharacterized protein n=1 Tax=Haliangium ochraceum (strain DSM 14365 / JCM 11303 / SMP-2) TaxID=502025 RepID=D0LSV7_HALO1|nr:hypothetical protein [Haliangium ochraceum]ACY17329.1 hypothetical protein Hoch_4840 [Haliangium ochraceum DSM 14365]
MSAPQRAMARRARILALTLAVGAGGGLLAHAQSTPEPAAAPAGATPERAGASDTAGNAARELLAQVLGQVGDIDWHPLPPVADRVAAALQNASLAGAQSSAWGDPALGCFVILARVPGGSAEMHSSLRDALAPPQGDAADSGPRAPRTIASDFATELAETRIRSRFDLDNGLLRGSGWALSQGVGTVPETWIAACAYSEREPELSARLCQRISAALARSLERVSTAPAGAEP